MRHNAFNQRSIIKDQALGTFPIMIAGSEDQKKKYGPLLARGERIINFGLTEPEAGSDASMMTTRAELKKDQYILNGTKHFMSNGPIVTSMVVFAMTDPSKGTRGISALIVDKEVSKFMVGKVESKMGIRGAPTSEILFQDCPVPKENLLGGEGKGFRIAMAALDAGRPTIAAQAVGLAQGAMEKAIRYSKERIQFGKPISEFQGIQWMFADMACEIEAARALTYQTCNLIDQNDPQKTYLSACCKLFATDDNQQLWFYPGTLDLARTHSAHLVAFCHRRPDLIFPGFVRGPGAFAPIRQFCG